MLNRTIQVGTVTLTLGLNNGFNRYEGVTENSRVLVRHDPWGTWSACVVKRNGKGSMITISGDYFSPEAAGNALVEAAAGFHKALGEFIGK
ncbi:hypothetical protein M0R72_01345 [Candidatus Pacearchaeota archaeon]|jgi:hypothetical protein|nr:hypothetical protein [Candidatus Pacearchaeota archaeon]